MEFIDHAATGEIIPPQKTKPPVNETKTFCETIMAIEEPAKNLEQHSPSSEVTKENENVEDFIRSMLLDSVYGTTLLQHQRNRLSSKFKSGGGWRSWTELWVDRYGDVCPEVKETQDSEDYESGKTEISHPSPSAKAASEPPVPKRTKSFCNRMFRLFTCCVSKEATTEAQEYIDSPTSPPKDATGENNFNQLLMRESFGLVFGLRRSASTIW